MLGDKRYGFLEQLAFNLRARVAWMDRTLCRHLLQYEFLQRLPAAGAAHSVLPQTLGFICLPRPFLRAPRPTVGGELGGLILVRTELRSRVSTNTDQCKEVRRRLARGGSLRYCSCMSCSVTAGRFTIWYGFLKVSASSVLFISSWRSWRLMCDMVMYRRGVGERRRFSVGRCIGSKYVCERGQRKAS